MDRRRHEPVAQRVHRQQRRHLGGVAEVVAVVAAGQRRAGGRLGGDDADVACRPASRARNGNARPAKLEPPPTQPMRRPGRRPPSRTAPRLLADHGLVQQDMVEHAAERVLRVVARRRRPRPPRRSRCRGCPAFRVRGQDRAARRSSPVGRARRRPPAPELDHRAAVRLLVVRGPHHVDLDSRPSSAPANASAEPHWPAPVSVASRVTPSCLVVVGLGDRGVRLVRSRRA